MGLILQIYVKEISDDIIPKIVEKLNEFEMECEFHPDFHFLGGEGFLPIKFKLLNTKYQKFKNEYLITGFEIYYEAFDLDTEKQKIQSLTNKLLNPKLFKRQNEPIFFESPKIDDKLKNCTLLISFVWGDHDDFDFRFAVLISAIITKLTNGICCYPSDDLWYDNESILEDAKRDIEDYEDGLDLDNLQYHKFNGWDT